MFTIDELEKLYKKNEKRLRLGKDVSEYEIRLTIATGHALDLIETSKYTNGRRLDLTYETMENFSHVLALRGTANRTKEGLSEEETIEDLVKKASSYEMFCLCGELNDGQSTTCEMILSSDGSELVLHAKNLQSGAEVTFNIFDAYRRAQRDKGVFTLVSSDIIRVHAGLASNIVLEEFLKPLGLDAEA